MIYVIACVLIQPSVLSKTNTLKGTPDLYFLSEVLIISAGRHT